MSMNTEIKWRHDGDSSYHGVSAGGYSMEASRDVQQRWRWWVWHNGEQISEWDPANRPETGEKAKEMCTLAVQKHKEKHQ